MPCFDMQSCGSVTLTLGTVVMLEANRMDTSGSVVLWKLDLMEYLEVDAALRCSVRSRTIVEGSLSLQVQAEMRQLSKRWDTKIAEGSCYLTTSEWLI
jgi:hypothetical protein